MVCMGRGGLLAGVKNSENADAPSVFQKLRISKSCAVPALPGASAVAREKEKRPARLSKAFFVVAEAGFERATSRL